MRKVLEVATKDGLRYRVRYRLDGAETSETFPRKTDAETFRDILGNGKGDRLAQALRWLDQRQTGSTGATITFREWFAAHMENLTDVTPRTRGDYWSIHRRYLDHLDPLPLAVISREHVTRLVNKLDDDGRAPKTIRQAVHLLSTVMERAVIAGHITVNPCRNIRLPKNRLGGTEPRFLTDDEFGALFDATTPFYQPLVAFLFGTGMRWSEASAIEGRHVNLRAGTIRVEQAWKRVPGHGYVIGPPKTAKAKRTVNPAVIALAAAKSQMRGPRDYVFVTRSGGPLTHANFYNNVWRPSCERAGLDPNPRIHDARHSHASWLISDGQSLEAVQDQLGHESIETTRKVYAHLLPAVGVAVGQSASAALAAAMGGRGLPSPELMARHPLALVP